MRTGCRCYIATNTFVYSSIILWESANKRSSCSRKGKRRCSTRHRIIVGIWLNSALSLATCCPSWRPFSQTVCLPGINSVLRRQTRLSFGKRALESGAYHSTILFVFLFFFVCFLSPPPALRFSFVVSVLFWSCKQATCLVACAFHFDVRKNE